MDGAAELAFEQVDDGRQTTGIDEVRVSLAPEIASRNLQLFDLVRHENMYQTPVRCQ
jgi:hypothetical protein